MKSVKMFGKKMPILGIVLIALLASGGVYAALVSYLSNTVTTSTSVVSPIALSGEVIYWEASDGVLGTKIWDSPTTQPSAEWFMLTDGTYAAHLNSGTAPHPASAYTGAGEARVLIPVDMTLAEIAGTSGMTWDENLVTGYESHADVYFDINEDGVAEDAIVFEYAYNTGTWPLIDNAAMGWANSGAPGPLGAAAHIHHSLADWCIGVTYTTSAGTFTVSGTTKVIRVEIEVDNWIVDSEAYIDDVEINDVTHDLEPTIQAFVSGTPTPLPVFAGSEFYFNFDALNSANLEMDGKLEIDITCGLTWASPPGDEFDPVTGYTFSISGSTLSLDADTSVTFYPEVVKEIDLRLKIAPNVAPDTFVFDALIAP